MKHQKFYRLVLSLVLLCAPKVNFSQTNFWQFINAPQGGLIQAFAINSSGHLFAANLFGVFRSTDDGQSWQRIGSFTADNAVISFAINASGHIFAWTIRDGVFRSTDNGNNWTRVNTGLTNLFVNCFTINSSGHFFTGTDGGVFRSTNNGDSWVAVNSGLTNLVVNALAVNSNGHIFAGTGSQSSSGMIFRSINNGDSWTPANTGITSGYTVVLAINASDHIFAGTNVIVVPSGGTMWRSTNNGDTWISIKSGLPSFAIAFDLIINARGHIFMASPGDGVFRSDNNGDSWTAVNSGLTDKQVEHLAINPNGYIFVATGGGNIFRSVDPTTAVKEVTNDLPKTFTLEQNYPNPFNPETTIQFILPRSTYVTLKVYNTLGIEVRTLVAEYLSAGRHQVKLNASQIADGVYFYRLQANEFFQTNKLIVVK